MTTSPGTAMRPETDRADGLLSSAHRATTIGIFALVSLQAFESLALTTVMPTIARDLDGESLYAMAFTATVAAGIVSVVWSGNLADRRGPRLPLLLGLLLFALGLVSAGLAPTMPVLVAARVVQGLGAGMTSTALYVLVTRLYPSRLHTAVFAGFAAAWVIPSVVGPFVAGVITQSLGWRWVFGLSLGVLVAAAALLGRILPRLHRAPTAVPWRGRAIAASIVLAASVLVLNATAAEVGPIGLLAAVPATIVLVASLRPLVPVGTLTARRGLPADVTVRGLSFAAFTGAEIYLPRLLTERDGFSPVLAGLSLTLTGVTWFLGSSIQGRWSARFEIGRTVQFGLAVETLSLSGLAVGAALGAPAWVLIALFPLAGFGIGTLAPRVTAQALARAGDDNQGFVSSALQIGDSSGAATALAMTAIVFAMTGSGIPGAYVAVFAAAAVPGLVGWVVAPRVR